jgi:transcriptional regulator with XRE-family HTH domain
MKSDDPKAITSAQLRAARGLLRWSAENLAQKAMLGVATIRRAEAADGSLPTTTANTAAIRRAFEAAGVEFIDENGGGPGVRLKKGWSRKK